MSGPTTKLRRKPAGGKGKSKHGVQRASRVRHGKQNGTLSRTAQSAGPVFGLGGAQRKVTVGQPGDRYEREADAVADRVVTGQKAPAISSLPAGGLGGTAQRQPADEDEKREENLQAKSVQRQPVEEEEEQAQAKPIQRQGAGEEEEEPVQAKAVQRQPREEEEETQANAVQRQAGEEEEPVQAQADDEEEEPVQNKSESPAPSLGSVASRALTSKSPGAPLAPSTRRTLESGIGADLGDVRVHDNGQARDAARDMNARAFTHGNNIWLGPGESQHDVRLMAHEATHVVQQTGGIHQMVQRTAKKTSAKNKGDQVEDNKLLSPVGNVDDNQKTMDVFQLSIPPFKVPLSPAPFTLPKKIPGQKRDTDQIRKWEQAAGKSTIVDRKIKEPFSGIADIKIGDKVFYPYALKGAKGAYVLGPLDTVKKAVLRPYWSEAGRFRSFHVDHMKEIQLGGADETDNMWLLQADTNMSSGGKIAAELERRITTLGDRAAASGLWKKKRDYPTIRSEYAITIRKTVPGKRAKGEPGATWKLDEVMRGKPLEALSPLTKENELKRAGIGNTDEFVLFTRESGGDAIHIPWGSKKKSFGTIGRNFRVTGIDKDATQVTGTGFGEIRKKKKKHIIKPGQQLTFDITKFADGVNMGYVTGGSVIREVRNLQADPFSPISIDNAELGPADGIVASGKINASLPFFNQFDVDLAIVGEDVRISKTFDTGDFQLPGPIQFTGSSLTLFGGTDGIGVGGEALFEVKGLGGGRLFGSAAAQGGGAASFELGGELDLDTALFKPPSKVQLKYTKEKFSGGANLYLDAAKVKGIKSGRLKVTIDGENWDAQGEVQPDVPGVQEGTLFARFDKETGFEIGGSLKLAKLPGVRTGAELKASIRSKDDRYAVKAAGTVPLDIPGVSAGVQADYDDGTFTAEATVGYKKQIVDGSLTVGVTNRAVAEEGKPAGEPGPNLTIYGGGSVTLKIAPWLQGTVGLKLRPDGEIEVTGKIGLPDKLQVFPEKKLEKQLLSVGIDIPVVGVAVAGQRIGIFVNISGSLTASAGIGPGELRQLELEVFYNPSREEDTTVTGRARFVVPAHAGLRLAIRGGLGVGIPIVSAQAGLEVGGSIGIEGEGVAAATVNWTPKQGIELDAQVSVTAEPKFKFDVSGFVLVEADLLVTTIELYEKRWQLAAFEYGSGLKFGVELPIKYREGQPFDISLDDVRFIKPDIDVTSLLKGLVKNIA